MIKAKLTSKVSLALAVAVFCTCLLMGWQSPVQAQQVWHAGTVTKDAWFERYNRIEIESVRYVFMPEVAITLGDKQYLNVKGDEQTQLLSNFYAGRRVTFSAHGHRIFEIMLDE